VPSKSALVLPAASGNIITQELVFRLDTMSLNTGVWMDSLSLPATRLT
jgi:hypothetical protein